MGDMVFGWLKDNKDGVLALAALISPATAMIAAFVSYRAVVTGPRIQREIAQRQFDLNNRQIKLQEETLALATRQLRANLLGSSDQKWIETFRDTLAELMGLVREKLPIMEARKQNPEVGFMSDRLLELMARAGLLINKIRLLLGSSDLRSHAFTLELQKWLVVNDLDESAVVGEKIIATAVAIIKEREERIASHIVP